MAGSGLSASFKAAVAVRPIKSQVFLVVLAIIGASCLAFGFFLLREYHSYAWLPMAVGAVILLVSCLGWLIAQKDTDLEAGLPTTITDSKGFSLSTDTRTLNSPNKVMQLASLLTIIAQRQTLPEPEGLVDENGKPISGSKEEAKCRVADVNHMIQTSTNEVIAAFGESSRPSDSIQPRLEEPQSEILMQTNIPPNA